MSTKQIIIGSALLSFVGVIVWALLSTGPTGWIAPMLASPATIAATVDLMLALTICVGWMWGDARRSGMNPLPYTILTVFAGSAGPLLYLFNREGRTGR